jgi:hypothetical protein
MDKKVRGWIYIIGALLSGYFTYSGRADWSAYVLALLFLVSGYHHGIER